VITTEHLVCDVAERAILKGARTRSRRLDLTDIPGVYPIRIPVWIDARAAADREGDKRVSALAAEILAANQNAVVISDGVREADRLRVLTHQSAKGRNGLEHNDVFVVVTNLAPAKFAELNVLGQWLDLDKVIEVHYADQINQAVGRNRGFRDKETGSLTAVITSLRLWSSTLSKLHDGATRNLLYLSADAPWVPPVNERS
jgi:hypothetical protein